MDADAAVKTDYIFRMTDDTGMFQHAVYTVPDPAEGYTSDDNARALMMAELLREQRGGPDFDALLVRYASFLRYAQNQDGTFRNFMGYDRNFQENVGSEDCFGRCLWAVCFLLSRPSAPSGVRRLMGGMLGRAEPNCRKLTYLRAKAYAAAALSLLGKDSPYAGDAARLGGEIAESYRIHRGEGWRWFEDGMTYCNAVLPRAMLLASEACGRPEWKKIGLESLDFLETQTTENGHFHAVGCRGWLRRGGRPAPCDEQPVECGATVLAELAAARVAGDPGRLRKAADCFSWFFGKNALRTPLVDFETGGCRDGLTAGGPNQNEGAESLVSFWIARLSLGQAVPRAR